MRAGSQNEQVFHFSRSQSPYGARRLCFPAARRSVLACSAGVKALTGDEDSTPTQIAEKIAFSRGANAPTGTEPINIVSYTLHSSASETANAPKGNGDVTSRKPPIM